LFLGQRAGGGLGNAGGRASSTGGSGIDRRVGHRLGTGPQGVRIVKGAPRVEGGGEDQPLAILKGLGPRGYAGGVVITDLRAIPRSEQRKTVPSSATSAGPWQPSHCPAPKTIP
jgi:hypothetical protein